MPENYKLFDDLLEGVFILDNNFKFLYMNDIAVDHGQYNKDELLGFSLLEKYPLFENTKLFQMYSKSLDEKKSQQMTNSYSFPDGTVKHYLIKSTPCKDGLIVMSIDMTEQIEAAEILAKNNQWLETLVKKRVTEIEAQKSIIEKQVKELNNLDAIRNRFFRIIAHDIKAPLSSLKLFTDILSTDAAMMTQTEISGMAKSLNQSVDNTLLLLKNLTSWAQVQMKELKSHPEDVNLKQLIDEVLAQYKIVAQQKSIAVTCDFNGGCEIVRMDRGQLSFIVRNLINNALKFTNRSGYMDIKLSNDDLTCTLKITDDGIGMSEEILSKVFELDNKSLYGTDGESGTGLGLVLCKEYIESHGGHIDIQSQLGQGTSVTVKLPK